MFLWSILLVLLIPPLAEACVPTVPPEEYYPTASLPEETTRPMQVTPVMSTTAGGGGATVASTTAAENMCGDCDINDIAPATLPTGVKFDWLDQDPVDGCIRVLVYCQRTDDTVCNKGFLYAENPTGTHSIFDQTSGATVDATLSCDKDGTFSWMDVTGITSLSCSFEECM